MSASTLAAPRTLADAVGSRPFSTTQRNVALVVGFAVLTAVLAQVRVTLPFTPVPITGQTLGVLLAGAALGWKRGALSQLLYWAVGIVMPVMFICATTGFLVFSWNLRMELAMSSDAITSPPGESTLRMTAFTSSSSAAYLS